LEFRERCENLGAMMTWINPHPNLADLARCGLSDRVAFQVGDAPHLPFEDASVDAVFLQHFAMNIEDRGAL
jgi:ubiquinone/menaquinone biosynthesis C-methylase UbiE